MADPCYGLCPTYEALPAKESEFIDERMAEVYTTKLVAGDYELG